MAVSNIVPVLQGVFAGHASTGTMRGTQPPVVAGDWVQFGKKKMFANHLADAAAATTSEDSIDIATPNYASGILIFGFWILPSAAVTFNASNFATLQLGSRPNAGGGSQTAIGASLNTSAVSWVANSAIAVFTSVGGIAVAQNLVITCAVTKGGTGVIVPQTQYVVEWAEA